MIETMAVYLDRDTDHLADDIVRNMLEAKPDLYARYSEAAPARTREDVVFHLRHLTGALVANDPALFRAYYTWLLSVLLPRGIVQEDIDLNFRCMSESLQATYGSEARPALDYIAQATARSDAI